MNTSVKEQVAQRAFQQATARNETAAAQARRRTTAKAEWLPTLIELARASVKNSFGISADVDVNSDSIAFADGFVSANATFDIVVDGAIKHCELRVKCLAHASYMSPYEYIDVRVRSTGRFGWPRARSVRTAAEMLREITR